MARIFLVDDDQAVLRMMSLLLRGEGHQISTFTNAEALLPRLGEAPEILISDLKLPGASGLVVAAEARRVSPRTRIIICSGDTTDEVAAALENGSVDLAVTKPWRAADLLRSIESLLAGKSAATH
jgi:CheY-like chemotaxis protein